MIGFQVDLSMEEWTALIRLVQDNVESLDDWDGETQDFWQILLYKLQEGARG